MFACVARSFSQVVLGLPLGLVPCRRPIIRSSVMPSFLTMWPWKASRLLSITLVLYTQVHAEAYWFAGEVYVSERALQLFWRLSYQDYIISKDQVWQVFTVYVDSFVLPVDLIDNGVLQTWSKEFGWNVVALFHSPLQLDLVAVPVELQGRCSAIIKIS